MDNFLWKRVPHGDAVRVVVVVVAAFCCAVLASLTISSGVDSDGDGVDDGFELFFGMAVGVNDGPVDPDLDGLDNQDECEMGTDPFSPDTDLDGWLDGDDMCPVSRAVYLWGDPQFTVGESNLYVRPDWASFPGSAEGGYAYSGGTYAYGWSLESSDDKLLMYVDRTLISNDLWMAVALDGGGEVSATMLDSNFVAISSPVALVAAQEPWFTNRISLSVWPASEIVSLQSTSGAFVAVSVLYKDSDGDGFDDAQNEQLILAVASTNTPTSNDSLSQAAADGWVGFEDDEGFTLGLLDGQQGWAATAGSIISSNEAFEGSQCLLLSRNEPSEVASRVATKTIGDYSTNGVVWVSLMQWCVPNGPRLSREEIGAGAFIVDQAGYIVAYDGVTDTWKASNRSFPNITGRWIRVDFWLNYNTKTYTLCVDGLAVHRDLGFANTSLSTPRSLLLRSDSAYEGGDVKADAIRFSCLEPNGLDFDGDGLSNANERDLGTDLWNEDTDGDGLDDALEIELGSSPFIVNIDYDNDGISNEDERVLYGTDPTKIDSDLDGTNDLALVASVSGAEFVSTTGVWFVNQTSLRAEQGVGMRADYVLAAPSPGFYILDIAISSGTTITNDYHLAMNIDDAQIANLASPVTQEGVVWRIRMPWLPAGAVHLRLAWIEDVVSVPPRILSVDGLSLYAVDANEGDARDLWCKQLLVDEDRDRDSLPDCDEIGQLKTLSTRLDSDVDGLFDADELTTFLLDPTLSDSDSDGIPDSTVVCSWRGSETSARYITHITTDFSDDEGDILWAASTSSSCAYDLTVTNAGYYVLQMDALNVECDPPDDYQFNFGLSLVGKEFGVMSVAADVGHVGKGSLVTPWLTSGTHRFKVTWKNRSVDGPRESRPALRRVRLLAVNGADTDGDGIQDWMEERLLSSEIDTDGDGIKDRDEVLTFGSSPLLVDSDGDGLSDKSESLFGTSLIVADTDGDGLTDGEEVLSTGTAPLSAEFDGVWSPIATCLGREVALRQCSSYNDGDDLVLTSRGNIEYLFTLSSADKPILRLFGRHEWRVRGASEVLSDASDCLVYVDDQFVARCFLYGERGYLSAVLPYIQAGQHRVRLEWNSLDNRMSLRITRLELGALGGGDNDSDGIRDWIVSSGSRTNRVSYAPVTSALSPVCLEGTARWPLLSSAVSGGEPVPVLPGVAGQWYSNLSLEPSGEPTTINLSFENGANTACVSVAWSPLNLLGDSVELNARVGDALRVTAMPLGGVSTQGVATVQVAISNIVQYAKQIQSGETLDILLNQSGEWRVSVSWNGSDGVMLSKATTVWAFGAQLPVAEPACFLGRQRAWKCPGMTPGVVLQADSGLGLLWDGTNALLTVNRMYADHYIVSRAGVCGAVIDSRRVNTFWLQSAIDSFLSVVEKRETSQVWENRMATLGLPPDVEVELRIFVSGVTFDDLSLLRQISGTLLPGASSYRFRMVRLNSVTTSCCHTIKAYQDGVFLGEAYQAGIGLPSDLR